MAPGRFAFSVSAGVLGLAVAIPAAADMITAQTYELQVFNNPGLSTAGLRFVVEVSNAGLASGEGARFRIANDSLVGDSAITGVYFDDGVLLGLARVENPDKDVWFIQGNAGEILSPDLPGGDTVNFSTTEMFGAKFAADAEPLGPQYGVNRGEYVDIYFQLINGHTIADVIRQMEDGTIAVGVHIQGMGEFGAVSASAVTFAQDGPPIPVVPAPGAVLLAGVGLLSVALIRKYVRQTET